MLKFIAQIFRSDWFEKQGIRDKHGGEFSIVKQIDFFKPDDDGVDLGWREMFAAHFGS